LVYIVVLVLVVCLCPSSVHVVATFSGTVLFPLLCSVLPFFLPNTCMNNIKSLKHVSPTLGPPVRFIWPAPFSYAYYNTTG